jgi:CitB family two-component system sensor histidine kinase CitS
MIVGKVPIMAEFEDYNRVIGTVSVEFLEKDIYENIFNRIKTIMLASTVVFFLGFIGSIFLAKSIRKDTLGLEPHEIASLYRERNAILLSIKEGIIAIDQKGSLTLINHSAISMLELNDDILLGQHIDHVLPDSKILEVLKRFIMLKFRGMGKCLF